MRYFQIERGDNVEILSEEEILDGFYDSWKAMKIKKFGAAMGEASLSEEKCLIEWSMQNKATEVQFVG